MLSKFNAGVHHDVPSDEDERARLWHAYQMF